MPTAGMVNGMKGMNCFDNMWPSRMLKQSASFVLGSSKSSTYPRGYASGFDFPAALLDGLFEHPTVEVPVVHTCRPPDAFAVQHCCTVTYN